jgi:hypothetical protein
MSELINVGGCACCGGGSESDDPGPPIDFCDCVIHSSTLGLSGFSNAPDEYATMSGIAGACVGSLVTGECNWNIDETFPVETFTCQPSIAAVYGTSRCFLSNLNRSYETFDIVPSGGTAAVTHTLGVFGDEEDRGVLVTENQFDFRVCCTGDDALTEGECEGMTPTIPLTIWRRTYVWKITYSLFCQPCYEGGNMIRATGNFTFHTQSFDDWQATVCSYWADSELQDWYSADPTGVPGSGTGPAPGGHTTPTNWPAACSHSAPGGITLQPIVSYDAGCIGETDCCTEEFLCFGCESCGDCDGISTFASVRPGCPGDVSSTPNAGCDGESQNITATVSVS